MWAARCPSPDDNRCQAWTLGRLLFDKFVRTTWLAYRNAGVVALMDDRWCSAGANHGSARRPFQEAVVGKHIEHTLAVVHAEVPQANGLRERQLETRHLHEVGLYAIDEGCKVHRSHTSNLEAISSNRYRDG